MKVVSEQTVMERKNISIEFTEYSEVCKFIENLDGYIDHMLATGLNKKTKSMHFVVTKHFDPLVPPKKIKARYYFSTWQKLKRRRPVKGQRIFLVDDDLILHMDGENKYVVFVLEEIKTEILDRR